MSAVPSVSYSITVRLEVPAGGASVSQLTTAVEQAGGAITALDVTASGHERLRIDVTCAARDTDHADELVEAMRGVPGVVIGKVSDRTFLMHLGGKIEMNSKHPIRNRDDLSMIYTPGVARVCLAIAENPEDARRLTIKRNSVAVVTDGSAVLGLGNIGPRGGAAGDGGQGGAVQAVRRHRRLADLPGHPGRGRDHRRGQGGGARLRRHQPGGHLRARAASRWSGGCASSWTSRSSTTTSTARRSSCWPRSTTRCAWWTSRSRTCGSSCPAPARRAPRSSSCCWRPGPGTWSWPTSAGSCTAGRDGLTGELAWLAEHTNELDVTGSLSDALAGADVFIGVSAPNLLTGDDIATMADRAVVFALANPEPEVDPAEAARHAAVVATGRSDFPNQINNVLAFPGVFRGLLDAHSTEITTPMLLAAASALAGGGHRRRAERRLHHAQRLPRRRAPRGGHRGPPGRRGTGRAAHRHRSPRLTSWLDRCVRTGERRPGR